MYGDQSISPPGHPAAENFPHRHFPGCQQSITAYGLLVMLCYKLTVIVQSLAESFSGKLQTYCI